QTRQSFVDQSILVCKRQRILFVVHQQPVYGPNRIKRHGILWVGFGNDHVSRPSILKIIAVLVDARQPRERIHIIGISLQYALKHRNGVSGVGGILRSLRIWNELLSVGCGQVKFGDSEVWIEIDGLLEKLDGRLIVGTSESRYTFIKNISSLD